MVKNRALYYAGMWWWHDYYTTHWVAWYEPTGKTIFAPYHLLDKLLEKLADESD